jgi:hypothetical protein
VNFVLVEQNLSSDQPSVAPKGAKAGEASAPAAPPLRRPVIHQQAASPPRAMAHRQTPAAMPAIALKNRRWSQRSVFNKTGVIGADALGQPLQCTVLDISKNGAQLEPVSGAQALPECFILVFYTNRIRSEANCVVRWRAGNKVGVCFAGPVRTCVERRAG